MRNTIKSVLAIKDFDKDVLIRGWVRTFRNAKTSDVTQRQVT